MPPQHLHVFQLCRQDGKTYDKAAILNISKNAVKKNMVLGMRFIYEYVHRYGDIIVAIYVAVKIFSLQGPLLLILGYAVAVADKPAGPDKDLIGKPLIDQVYNGAQPIDQFVFHDKDGQVSIILFMVDSSIATSHV